MKTLQSVVLISMFSCLFCFLVDLNENEVEKFINPPASTDSETEINDFVTVVAFYPSELELDPTVLNFRRLCEKSVILLEQYGIKLAMVKQTLKSDKTAENPEKEDQPGIEIIIFRNGIEIVNLEQDYIFDVDSMLSNALQVLLIKETPILEDTEKRKELENKIKGQKNMIVSYHSSIGTREHRIFMEVAHAFQSYHQFAVFTSEEMTTNLPVRSSKKYESNIWLFHCSDKRQDEDCDIVEYTLPFEMFELTRFLVLMNDNFLIQSDVATAVIEEENMFNSVVLITDDKTKAKADDIAEALANKMWGKIRVIILNSDELPSDVARHYTISLPDISYVPGGYRSVADILDVSVRIDNSLGLEEMENKIELLLKKTFEENELRQQEKDEGYRLDDNVAEMERVRAKEKVNRKNLPVLTDKTFPKFIEENEFAVVLFYLQFDAKGKLFLRTFAKIADALAPQYHLAGIECYDWTDVCGKNNITKYPVVRVYRKGKDTVDYKGMLDAKSVVSMIKLRSIESPHFLSSSQDVTSFKQGELPEGISSFTPISVLGLFDKKHKKGLSAFKEAAEYLGDKYMFGYVSDEIVSQVASKFGTQAPAVVIMKRNDETKPFSVYTDEMDQARIVHAVNEAALPVYAEITVYTFPSLYAKKKPFLILFDGSEGNLNKKAHDCMKELTQSLQHITVAWMNVDDKNGIGKKVLEHYSPDETPTGSHIFMVDHQEGTIHKYKGEFEAQEVQKWIEDVQNLKIPSNRYLMKGDWRPKFPGIDFLAKIDELEAKEKESQKDEEYENEREYDSEAENPQDMDGEHDELLRQDLMRIYKQSQQMVLPDDMNSFSMPSTGKPPHTEL